MWLSLIPGVGSARRPILVEAAGQYFIGPDNGVLAMVYAGVEQIPRNHRDEVLPPSVSHTFMDGIYSLPQPRIWQRSASRLRSELDRQLPEALIHGTAKNIQAAVVGHRVAYRPVRKLVTNFTISDFAAVRVNLLSSRSEHIRLTELGETYAEMPIGEPFVIVGSSGYLEVSANQGNGARMLGCGVGAPCELTLY